MLKYIYKIFLIKPETSQDLAGLWASNTWHTPLVLTADAEIIKMRKQIRNFTTVFCVRKNNETVIAADGQIQKVESF